MTRLDEVKAAKRAVLRYGFEEHPNLADEPAAVAEAPQEVVGGPARARADPRRAPAARVDRARAAASEPTRGEPVAGKPLPRRLRNFSHSADRYALSIAGPPAYSRRLREIEEEVAAHETALRTAWDDITASCGTTGRCSGGGGASSPPAGASTRSTS